MIQDMKQRETLARIDDDERRRKVDAARDIIYRQLYAVDTDRVEDLLRSESLVPIDVSTKPIPSDERCLFSLVECFFATAQFPWLQFICDASC
jgi:hypothetical protein